MKLIRFPTGRSFALNGQDLFLNPEEIIAIAPWLNDDDPRKQIGSLIYLTNDNPSRPVYVRGLGPRQVATMLTEEVVVLDETTSSQALSDLSDRYRRLAQHHNKRCGCKALY